MAFSVGYPLALLAVPAAAALIIYLSRGMSFHASARRRLIKGLRILVIVLIIAAAAGIGIRKASDNVTTIFAVDCSDSTLKSRAEAESFIREALKGKKPSDSVGMVVFGADSAVEFTASGMPVFNTIQTRVSSVFTNIGRGLEHAMSLIPSGDRKRIVLLSDGRENSGDGLRQARILRQQDIALDIFPITVPDSRRFNCWRYLYLRSLS
jgi:hypothetical protein